jgi:hypothetical protein
VIALIVLLNSPVHAQDVTIFSSTDNFTIPQLNGSIRFAYNGTYTSAALQNNTWVFRDLTLNGSVVLGNLSISVENSNITIFTFYSDRLSAQFNRYGYIRYNAEGAGTQTINLHLNTTDQTHSSEWGIVNPAGVFLAEGREWRLLPDNTVMVTGRTGNVTVAHYGFDVGADGNLPFYMQHSIALIIVGVVAVTVAVASLITFKVRRNH